MQNGWTSPSGSRWEPAAPTADPVPAQQADPGPRRRHRRPAVAVLLTVLGAAAVTTTGVAYGRGDAPAVSTPAPSSAAVDGPGHHGGPHGHDHGPRS